MIDEERQRQRSSGTRRTPTQGTPTPAHSRATRLSTRTKLLFSTGDLSSSLPMAIQMFFQLYFLTDVARLSPATAGWVLAISRAWDAVNDPLVGYLSDRLDTRFGRRRVLLMIGAIPLGVFFALCWFVPPFGQFGLAVYYTLVIIAFDTAFTVVNVGFNALTPTMTYDYDERSNLNGYRMVFSLSGTLAAIILATLLSDFTSSESQRFALLGVTLGIAAAIPPWIVCWVAAEPAPTSQSPPMPFRESLRATFANRAFAMLMLIYLTSWTAASVMAAMLVYYASYYLQVPAQANYFVLVAEGVAILFVPVCVLATKKWDKPRAYMIGVGGWCVVLLGISALPRDGVGLAFLFAAMCGPGIATAFVVPWSMVPDVIEWDQAATGQRREGAYYSFVAFFQKLGTGFALWAIGQMLAASGYIVPTADMPSPDQPAATVSAIRWIIGPGTVTLLLASLPFAWWYPISRESHAARLEQLGISTRVEPEP